MKLTEFSVKKPVTVLMIFLCILILGLVSLGRLAVDLFPNFNLPMAAVITTYPGAGPQEVESMVTKPLEQVLGTVQRVDNISSVSSFGSSMVLIEFTSGTDMDFAALNMREKIDLIKGYLPADAEQPMVVTMDPAMLPIMVIGFSAGQYDLTQLKEIAQDTVQPRIERQEGVASVEVAGGYDREIKVIVDPVKLQAYGVSLSQIASVIQAENLNLAVSTISDGAKEFSVRAVGQYASLNDIRNVHIMLTGGNTILLSDIAQVVENSAKIQSIARLNGQPAIALSIYKQSDANLSQVAADIEKEMRRIQQDLPSDVQLVSIMNSADYINSVVDSLSSNLIAGGILSVIILLLFLRNFRSTLIISIAIPLCLVATFILIYFGGMTLNMMTLGGLSLGVGMMVDASIVILEGIFRKQEEGYDRKSAAIIGSQELANAVIASVLTTVVVFLPMLFTSGIVASLFKELAYTVTVSLMVSLLVALTLVPMLASQMLDVREQTFRASRYGKWNEKIGGWLASLDENYRKALHWSLAHRKKVVLAIAAMVVVSFALLPLVGMEFLPTSDAGQITISITMENGTSLAETDRVAKIVEQRVASFGEEVTVIYSNVGSSGAMFGASGSERASLTVFLVDKGSRKKGVAEIADMLRDDLADIPAADIGVTASDPMGMGAFTSGSGLSVSIKGDDLTILESLSEEVAELMGEVAGTREIQSSLTDTRTEMQITIDRNRAGQYGLTLAQVAAAARAAFEGQVASTYKNAGTELDIRVIYPDADRQNIADMQTVILTTPIGIKVPLGQIADFKLVQSPVTISRDNQSRLIDVTCQIYGRDLNSISEDVQAKLDQMVIPSGYSVTIGGAVQEMEEAFSDLSFALLLATVLVYMVMASIFESLIHPFVIMFSIPTAFIGIVLSLLLTGRTINVSSIIGVIVLIGVVVDNAIVLIDNVNRLRTEEGLAMRAAIEKAGPMRLRPILMTTLTTVLGVFPLVLGLGEGSELSAPMGTVVFGGLTVSTVFTLLFVPVVYTLIDDFGQALPHKIYRLRSFRIHRIKLSKPNIHKFSWKPFNFLKGRGSIRGKKNNEK